MTTEHEFRPQSYKWSAYRVIVADELDAYHPRNARLTKKEAGSLTEYAMIPGGEWHGEHISYSGTVKISEHSTGDAIIALASSGSWSGGSNYKGFIFGKPGAVVFFNCKGSKKWLVFDETGASYHDTNPFKKPVEL